MFTHKMRKKNIFLPLLISILLLMNLILTYISSHSSPISEFSSEDTILQRARKLEEKCGDLCNTKKDIQPGEFLGTVKSDASLNF